MDRILRKITVLAALAAIALAALTGCGAAQRLKGSDDGADSDVEARNVKSDDPLARPIQVAWTSARATRCGFIFSPEQLRANYLAAEAQTDIAPMQMQKIEKAYDYTRESVLATIEGDQGYCNKERTDAIRIDLNRYLAGDYTPSARLAR
ncbi:MAG: hypothetical protein ACREDO_10765 [Methyloceanibacter sp.]